MTPRARPTVSAWSAVAAAAVLVLAGCSGDPDDGAEPTAAETDAYAVPGPSPEGTATPEPVAGIDVTSSGDPTADAQEAEGSASLGTAAATIEVALPGEWQYEGTYGDGERPYAVLVDASQPFDLSEPGSAAYRDSVWVHVETYRADESSPYGGPAPEDAGDFASQLEQTRGGEARVIDGREVPVVHLATEDEEGRRGDELFARHGDIWIVARPSNVDVDAYVTGEDEGILHAVLEGSAIK